MVTYYTDTDILERAADRLKVMLSRMEESAGTMRQIYNQMQTEFGFDQYPQWANAVNACGNAVEDTEMLTGRMERFCEVISNCAESYRENERAHKNAVEKMSARMAVLQAEFSGIMNDTYPLGLTEGEETSAASKLEKETAAAVQDLEISNLMAISKILEEEYNFNKVVPMEEMTFEEPKEGSGE